MKSYLERDAFVFSGLKTHAQLAEARSYLKDENGNLTPYNVFEQKVLKLNKTYNQNYLEAEYAFAAHSAMSASQWAHLNEDTQRYWLEYRTAGDEHVRESHRQLDGITLPKSDAFWSEFYPPNGWRCRCIASEVLARNNKSSDPSPSFEKGIKATTQIGKNGKNKLEMFRFNPGLQQKLFPPKNSYTKVVGADTVKKVIEEQLGNLEFKEKLKTQRTQIKAWAKKNLIGKTVTHPKISTEIYFTVTGIKEALNQPHKHIIKKNEAVMNIEKLIENAEFVRADEDMKGRKFKYHYLKTSINKDDSYIVIREVTDDITTFYSITDKIKR